MGIFKEAQIKTMLGHVQSEQMTFSRMVELLNQEVYKDLALKGKLVTMTDVIKTLEAFLVHNYPVQNKMQLKFTEFINYIKDEVNEYCLTNLKTSH